MVALIGAKSCRSCEFRGKFAAGTAPAEALFCRRYPPQVFAVMGPKGPMMNATYPTVNADIPCGEYVRSETHALEEMREATLGVSGEARQ